MTSTARAGDRAGTSRRACRWVRLAGLGLAILGSAATQRPATGQAAPLPMARDLQGAPQSLKALSGPKGLVVFFWAGWSDRSLEELRWLDAERARLGERGVGLVAVNVEHQATGVGDLKPVRDRVASLGLTLPVIVDDGLALFKGYGVVSVPSTALIDGEGKLVSFFSGYSAGQREELFDAVEKLAGITREKIVVEVPKGSPAAVRRFEMGRRQLAAGRLAPAAASFKAAAEADPTFADPLVELAALALDAGDLAGAKGWLDKASAITPSHPALAGLQARWQAAIKSGGAGEGQ